MLKKTFYDTVISDTKDLVKYTQKTGVKFDPDVIHALRTTLKKVRALLRWQGVNKKIFIPYKKIYEAAGELRNIQVAKKKLQNVKDIPQHFKKRLLIMLTQFKQDWDTIEYKKPLKQLQHNIKQLKIKPAKHKKFIFKRMNAIRHIVQMNFISDTELHDARKMIKDMQYVLEWLKKNGRSKKIPTAISIKELKNIGVQAGEYMDKCILIKLFTAYAQEQTKPALLIGTNAVLTRWNQDKIIAKEKLVNMFSTKISASE